MARIDKYSGVTGGFRAPLAAAIAAASVGGVFAVSLDATGKVVIGTAAQSGFVGVICPDKVFAAGDVIDVMTQGEIVEFTTGANGAAFAPAVAGQVYTANASGAIQTTIPAAGVNYDRVGHTVEATRLVVRAQKAQG
jgi:hypothetical protein